MRPAPLLGSAFPPSPISQGRGDPPDFASGAAVAAQWLQDHRTDLLDGAAPPIVTSINVPTCARGQLRGLLTVPVAVDSAGRESASPDCATSDDPFSDDASADDLGGFLIGFATLSTFDSDLRPVG